jgi:hypothetical protein
LLGDFPALLRRVVFVGKAALCQRFDFQSRSYAPEERKSVCL